MGCLSLRAIDLQLEIKARQSIIINKRLPRLGSTQRLAMTNTAKFFLEQNYLL
jgi:hypothetical protein